jgi:hypothetical protein
MVRNVGPIRNDLFMLVGSVYECSRTTLRRATQVDERVSAKNFARVLFFVKGFLYLTNSDKCAFDP